MHPNQADTQHDASTRKGGISKLVGCLVLLAVLGLAFLGYLTPDMRIQWANLMTLCGF